MKKIMPKAYFENACDSMMREELLIKMHEMGVGGRLCDWIRDFCVEVGDAFSEEFDIVNGIPQGSAKSHILSNIMINNTFMNVGGDTGSSLYADDGALWKRGKNTRHVINCIQ